jgi:hypothetical protein
LYSIEELMPAPHSQSLLRSYGQFLRSPNLVKPITSSSYQIPFRHLLRLYSLHLFIVLILGLVISQVVQSEDSLLQEVLENMSGWLIVMTGVLFVPTVEEIVFRLPLRGTVQTLTPALSLFLWFLISWLGGSQISVLSGCVLIALNVFVWSKSWRKINTQIEQIYQTYPRWIFYGSAIAFGAIHITNYERHIWPLLPLVVLPQILVGLWFGFMRSRYGFIWAVCSHGFYNGTLLIPFVLLSTWGSPELSSADFNELDPQTLAISDQILMAFLGLYFILGVLICGAIAFQLIREAFIAQPTEIDPL